MLDTLHRDGADTLSDDVHDSIIDNIHDDYNDGPDNGFTLQDAQPNEVRYYIDDSECFQPERTHGGNKRT